MFKVIVVGKWDSSSDGAVDTGRYNGHSMETLVVVLAVITIVAVFAGIIARLCGGRHLGGSGEHDIEGCVERSCRSCIDGGLPPPPTSTSQGEKK
ncbi:hypothetical protein RND81_12G002600 [Saponaria officinalis]|uniref:Uncharacterized protein n=1 Tax=Saponaria officinalis TaxID=3572 RepID=A0AAW1H3M2_SAPOF